MTKNKDIIDFFDIWDQKDSEEVDYTLVKDGSHLLNLLNDDGRKWAIALSQYYEKYSGHKIDVEFLIPWTCNIIEHSNGVRRWAKEATEKDSLDNSVS